MIQDFKKIGIGLTACGLGFIFLGIILIFDAALIAMGNILFLSGVTLVIGPQRSVTFFFQKKKLKGSIVFFVGIALVLIKWPVIGIFVESFGFINLFGDFFPIAVTFLRRLPIIGNLLSLPYISDLVDKFVPSSKLPV